MPDHITDDEYQRLIQQDNAEETGDPWRREGPYGVEGKPFEPKLPEIQVPKRRRLVEGKVNYHEPRVRTCLVCHYPVPCNCIP